MASALRREEGYGLALAIAAHVGLAAFLLWRPPGEDRVLPPERMTVTISDDVGLTSTSPEPDADAAPDFAPQAGEAQPVAEPEPEPAPQPRIEPRPLPAPRPVARPEPRPVPKPTMRPTPRPAAPVPKAAPKAAPKPAPKAARTAQRPTTRPAGGTRIGADFLKGVSGAQGNNTRSNAPPAAAAGPAVQASLASAISRALKPRWAAPQGAEADQLVTILSWNLNPDGSLAGTPRVVRQEGITAANRPQAARHAEQAIRAVTLAAPFDLPPQYYDSWKRVASFRFDRRLSQ